MTAATCFFFSLSCPIFFAYGQKDKDHIIRMARRDLKWYFSITDRSSLGIRTRPDSTRPSKAMNSRLCSTRNKQPVQSPTKSLKNSRKFQDDWYWEGRVEKKNLMPMVWKVISKSQPTVRNNVSTTQIRFMRSYQRRSLLLRYVKHYHEKGNPILIRWFGGNVRAFYSLCLREEIALTTSWLTMRHVRLMSDCWSDKCKAVVATSNGDETDIARVRVWLNRWFGLGWYRKRMESQLLTCKSVVVLIR